MKLTKGIGDCSCWRDRCEWWRECGDISHCAVHDIATTLCAILLAK